MDDTRQQDLVVVVEYRVLIGAASPCRAYLTAYLPTVVEDGAYILSPIVVSPETVVWGHPLTRSTGELAGDRRRLTTEFFSDTWTELEREVGKAIEELTTTLRRVAERNAPIVVGMPERKVLRIDVMGGVHRTDGPVEGS